VAKKQEAKKPCQGQKEEGEGATARFVKKKISESEDFKEV